MSDVPEIGLRERLLDPAKEGLSIAPGHHAAPGRARRRAVPDFTDRRNTAIRLHYRYRMEIEKDTKDWTWVLDRTCPECGYEAGAVSMWQLPSLIRANAAVWLDVLARPDVRRRPSSTLWSPLEYACHVRDVFRIFDQRLQMMLAEDNPLFPNWDQDDTAQADRYWEQDPVLVSGELLETGDTVAHRFAAVTDQQWSRPGRRTDGAIFTVDSFARYFLHDPVHHLFDVTH